MTGFRMTAHVNGPRDDQCTAGWISLVDDDGVELWRTWVTPVPNEVWAELVAATREDAAVGDARGAQ